MEKALKLLTYLRGNSREKLTSISKKTRIPISTLFDTLKELQDGLITRSTVLVDFSKLGYHTRAKIIIKVVPSQKEDLRKHLFCHENVNSMYKINGRGDFLLETIHKTNRELDTFLDQLSNRFNLENLETIYLIEDVKRESFMLN